MSLIRRRRATALTGAPPARPSVSGVPAPRTASRCANWRTSGTTHREGGRND